jgi:signal recognition particle receptor subunit beta
VLQGLDGLVFVADSHPARESANRESLDDLHEHLTALGVSPDQRAKIGWVFQYNKRDLPAALPVDRLRRALNPLAAPEYEAVASEGRGVAETLRAACKEVIAQVSVTGLLPVPAPEAHTSPPAPARPRTGTARVSRRPGA